jgi:hypothetical protein
MKISPERAGGLPLGVTNPKVTNGTTNPHVGTADSSIAVARKDQSRRLPVVTTASILLKRLSQIPPCKKR